MDYGGGDQRPLNGKPGLCVWLLSCEASPCLRA